MKTLKQFARFYEAEILTRSGENSRLGDLYDWEGPFNNRLAPKEDNIINWVADTVAERTSLRQQIETAPTFKASFMEVIDLTKSLTVGIKPDLPNIPVDLAADITNKSVASFHFEGVLTRPMPDELGIELRRMLEEYKDKHFDKYKARLRPYDVAVALYYAEKVVLKLEHDTQVSVEAQTQVEAIGGSIKVGADGKQELRFNQSNCPFAVSLKQVKHY
jgi:hypothetical protein